MSIAGDKRALWSLCDFNPVEGQSFLAALPDSAPSGDDGADPYRSSLRLFEDGVELGPPHTQHAEIISLGAGRFSHWVNALYFSTTDGSDPRTNGRAYQILVQGTRVKSQPRRAAAIIEALPTDFSRAKAFAAIESALAVLYPEALLGEDQKLFWKDERLLETLARTCGDNRRTFERKFATVNLLKLISGVEGDIAECGVFEGATAYFVAEALEQAKAARPIHLFDSFEGLSAPSQLDGAFWASGNLSAAEAKTRETLRRFANCHFYKGWIPDRFSEVASRRFAFVHIDVDLYAPTRDSLAFFYPRAAPGAIILCDDYGFETCPGATAAMDEFFASRPEPIVHLPTGQAFVIKT